MSNEITAIEAHKQIQLHADNCADQELRHVEDIPVGKAVRQGDIYIRAVTEIPGKRSEIKERQLAPGNTQGSRHIAEGKITLFSRDADRDVMRRIKIEEDVAEELTGPGIEANERFTITHPEHADVSLPAGKYCVTYQADYELAEIRRVAD